MGDFICEIRLDIDNEIADKLFKNYPKLICVLNELLISYLEFDINESMLDDIACGLMRRYECDTPSGDNGYYITIAVDGHDVIAYGINSNYSNKKYDIHISNNVFNGSDDTEDNEILPNDFIERLEEFALN